MVGYLVFCISWASLIDEILEKKGPYQWYLPWKMTPPVKAAFKHIKGLLQTYLNVQNLAFGIVL